MRSHFRAVFDFKKEELPGALLLFSFFFFVMVAFQSLKSQKKALFVETYGADLELYAKLLNIALAAAAMMVFTYLYNHLPRQRLIYVLCAFFAAGFLLLAWRLRDPGRPEIWTFYLLGDLLSTLMVAAFFAYLTDISNADQAKRLYGVIGGGGVLGGLAGASLTAALLEPAGLRGLLLLAALWMGTVAAVTYQAERYVVRSGVFTQRGQLRLTEKAMAKKESRFSAAVEGARLVSRSRYLAAIVGIMAFYEIASQSIDYQFSHVSEALSGLRETQVFLANVSLVTNLAAVVVQFILVSLIMRKLGLVVALLILPVAVTGGSLGFLMAPGLLAASLLFISDNGLNYSLQQTARESLYVVTTPDEKYKARAFTNMFVQRFAKGVAILGLLGLLRASVDIRYLSLITIASAVLVMLCGVYAGRRFEQRGVQPARKAA